jgi:hypothetical protein
MPPDALTLLSKAAKERRCAIIRYDGQHQIRAIEPHVIYADRAGNILVECFQTRGHCDTDEELPQWRTFELRKIHSVFLLNIQFRARVDAGFDARNPDYHERLITMVNDPATFVRDQRRAAAPKMLLSQVRGWWWEVGTAIDRVLSQRNDWPDSIEPDSVREPREH